MRRTMTMASGSARVQGMGSSVMTRPPLALARTSRVRRGPASRPPPRRESGMQCGSGSGEGGRSGYPLRRVRGTGRGRWRRRRTRPRRRRTSSCRLPHTGPEPGCHHRVTERAGRRLGRVVRARATVTYRYVPFPTFPYPTGARIRAEPRANARMCVTHRKDGSTAEALVVDELRDAGMAAIEDEQVRRVRCQFGQRRRGHGDVALAPSHRAVGVELGADAGDVPFQPATVVGEHPEADVELPLSRRQRDMEILVEPVGRLDLADAHD